MTASLKGPSKRNLRPQIRIRQLVIGHLAQAGWHLQRALAYCPDTSPKVDDVAEAARLQTRLVSPMGRSFQFVNPYFEDENATCYFGDELQLALWHLRRALLAGQEGNLRRCKLPDPSLVFAHRELSWPVSHKQLDELISHIESSMRTMQTPDPNLKGYEQRVKRRSKAAEDKVLKAVRRAERSFRTCQKAVREAAKPRAKERDPSATDNVVV